MKVIRYESMCAMIFQVYIQTGEPECVILWKYSSSNRHHFHILYNPYAATVIAAAPTTNLSLKIHSYDITDAQECKDVYVAIERCCDVIVFCVQAL